jgi:hypothetical protein
MHKSGEMARVTVLRGSQQIDLRIALEERPHKADSLVDSADPEKNLVSPLGILGIELNLDLAKELPDLRIPTGVVVAAKTLGGNNEVPLQTGDVIHGVNGTTVTTLAELRDSLGKLKPGDAVALLIERYAQMIFVSFSL